MNTTRLPLLAATFLALAAYPVLAQGLPAGEGKETVEKICGGCHDLEPITGSIGFSKDDWDIVIKSMIDMGATIKAEDAAVISAYLAKNFPPKPK
jgi:cytochrome c5